MTGSEPSRRVFDFHTHTFYSDGVLSPMEQARRAHVNGYGLIGMTDHMGIGGVDRLIEALRLDREVIETAWDLQVVVGVELTHVPANAIAKAAEHARAVGAEIVVVHGETPVEPVPAGTNRASVECGLVDVLAHPGFITLEEASMAADNGVFLEISARRGHSLTNGYVARMAQETGAHLIVNSDAHEPSDLLSSAFQSRVARGAGIPEELLDTVLFSNPRALAARVITRR
jgi:putative hydrolase